MAVTNGNGAGATSGALYAIGATGANGRTDGFALEQAMAMSTTTAIYQKKEEYNYENDISIDEI